MPHLSLSRPGQEATQAEARLRRHRRRHRRRRRQPLAVPVSALFTVSTAILQQASPFVDSQTTTPTDKRGDSLLRANLLTGDKSLACDHHQVSAYG